MSNIDKIRQEIERRKGKSYYSAMIELLNIIEVAQAQGGDDLVDYPSYKKGYFAGRRDEKEQMMKDAKEIITVQGSLTEPEFVKQRVIFLKED